MTDLRAEGSNRNRVARRLGPEAVEAAERLAGRLGLVPTQGSARSSSATRYASSAPSG
jgi:hypothetical protein